MTNSNFFLIKIFFFIFIFFAENSAQAQQIISGTVYDSTTLYTVDNVLVKSTSGANTFTDSVGNYHIKANQTDSIYFFYRNKYTARFPVNKITNYNHFDISLRVRLHEKYRVLKEITIFSKSHNEDSVENRESYDKVFNYSKPQVGTDIDELIDIFHFRKNKQKLQFQNRLIEQEKDKYVDYRFNAVLLKRITGLKDTMLENYRKQYRPSYAFLKIATEVEFYQYILDTADQFKKDNGIK